MTDRRGQALVEFALVVPILVLLVCAVFDGGRLIVQWNAMREAATAAARAGIVHDPAHEYRGCEGLPTKAECVQTVARVYLPTVQEPVTITATCRAGTGPATPAGTVATNCPIGSALEVRISAPFGFITPVVGSLISPPVVGANTVMRVES